MFSSFNLREKMYLKDFDNKIKDFFKSRKYKYLVLTKFLHKSTGFYYSLENSQVEIKSEKRKEFYEPTSIILNIKSPFFKNGLLKGEFRKENLSEIIDIFQSIIEVLTFIKETFKI